MDSSDKKVMYHGATVVDSAPGAGNPPPYNGYPPPGPAPYGPPGSPGPPVAQTVIHSSPATVIISGAPMGPHPTSITCKSCHAQIITRVDKKASTKTHLFALGLCLLGCWCCVCIPYCTDSCLTAQHYCPNCNMYLGNYSS